MFCSGVECGHHLFQLSFFNAFEAHWKYVDRFLRRNGGNVDTIDALCTSVCFGHRVIFCGVFARKLKNLANVMFGFCASMRYAEICASIYAYCWSGVVEVRSSLILGYISSGCLVCIAKKKIAKNMRKRVQIASKSWRNGGGHHTKLLTVLLVALYIRFFRILTGWRNCTNNAFNCLFSGFFFKMLYSLLFLNWRIVEIW